MDINVGAQQIMRSLASNQCKNGFDKFEPNLKKDKHNIWFEKVERFFSGKEDWLPISYASAQAIQKEMGEK